jgi:hypothetical protein
MKLTSEIANKIYDILVKETGALEFGRERFVYTQTHEDCEEYRFQGSLGFGGKFWNDSFYINIWSVSYYPEDENKKRLKIIKRTNKKLEELAISYENLG